MGVFPKPVGHDGDDLLDHRQDRIADDLDAFLQALEIHILENRIRDDRVRRFLGDHPQAALHSGHGPLDLEIAADRGAVGKDGAHLLGAEEVLEEDGFMCGRWHGVRSRW